MKFALQSGDFNQKSYDALIVGIFEKGVLSPAAKEIDKLAKGHLSAVLKQGDFTGKLAETYLLSHVPGCQASRVLLVGCGKNQPLSDRDYRKVITQSIKVLSAYKSKHALLLLTELPVAERSTAWNIKCAIESAGDALYRFHQYKTENTPTTLQAIDLSVSAIHKDDKEALKQGIAIAEAVTYTKNLANQPSNICNPTYIADQAKALAKEHKNIKLTILERKDMEKLGMGAFLAVTKGSAEPPKLVCLEYKGSSKKAAPVALVGKGITFDTGGLSLKPAESMVGMKYDMCGAATVLGTIKAAAELKLPLHIVGLLAVAENMPSGTATKPEDIVTSLSGQTIEIMNTDAEGRLVLCDTLTYCERFKPEVVIDIATLTGAVVIALGLHATGLLSNNDTLAKDLLAAGNESLDRAWQLPLWEEYQDQLKSPFADMSNVGGRMAGTITAACFLSRYAKKFAWAHLDVAGTAALMGGNDRYATGRPVPMLVQYLLNRCKSH